jgi:Fic family protein
LMRNQQPIAGARYQQITFYFLQKMIIIVVLCRDDSAQKNNKSKYYDKYRFSVRARDDDSILIRRSRQ